jgi:hypothetical protein
VYGPLDDEILFGKKNEWAYNVTLNNCVIKRTTALSNVVSNNLILNSSPQFKDYSAWDYHPLPTSPVALAGINIPGVIDDLDGLTRASTPSIGCYEVQ